MSIPKRFRATILDEIDALLERSTERLDAGDLDEAMRLAESALRVSELASGPDHPLVAHCVIAISRIARTARNYEVSRRAAERAVTTMTCWVLLAPDDALVARLAVTADINLAETCRAEGLHADAARLLLETIERAETVLAPDDAELGCAVSLLCAA